VNRGAKQNGRGASSAAMMGPRARTMTSSHGNDASAEHRRKLEALFSGGSAASSSAPAAPGLSASSMAMMGPSSSSSSAMPTERSVFASPRRQAGRRPSEYSLRLQAMRIAPDTQTFIVAADAFLAHHQLPDEMGLLIKVLQHTSERVLCNVMGQISFLLGQGRERPNIILSERLREIGERPITQATQSCLDGLRQQIEKLQQR
jgi:hypothetical protein